MKKLLSLLAWIAIPGLIGAGLDWLFRVVTHQSPFDPHLGFIRGMAVGAMLRAAILSDELERLRALLRHRILVDHTANITPSSTAARHAKPEETDAPTHPS